MSYRFLELGFAPGADRTLWRSVLTGLSIVLAEREDRVPVVEKAETVEQLHARQGGAKAARCAVVERIGILARVESENVWAVGYDLTLGATLVAFKSKNTQATTRIYAYKDGGKGFTAIAAASSVGSKVHELYIRTKFPFDRYDEVAEDPKFMNAKWFPEVA